MTTNLGKKLQRSILNRLNYSSGTSNDLANDFRVRSDYIRRQLGELQNDGLITHTEKYNGSTSRRQFVYSTTSLGKITLGITDDFTIRSESMTGFVRNFSDESIRNLATQSIEKLDKLSSRSGDDKPIRFSKLANTFHDEVFLSTLPKYGVLIENPVDKEETSDARIKKILDKKCDVASIPSDGLIEHLKSNPSSKNDLVIVAVSHERTPTKLIRSKSGSKDVYYSGGSARRKRAIEVSRSVNEVSSTELLKGISESDYTAFVANDPIKCLLDFEGEFKNAREYYDYSYLVTNVDLINKKNSNIGRIYSNHAELLSGVQNKNNLIKEIAKFAGKELLKFVHKNEKYFPNLTAKIKSESLC